MTTQDAPQPDDLSICSKCGEVAVFTKALTLRLPTPEEQEELIDTREMQLLKLLALVRTITPH